jgi:hypothetical protein
MDTTLIIHAFASMRQTAKPYNMAKCYGIFLQNIWQNVMALSFPENQAGISHNGS